MTKKLQFTFKLLVIAFLSCLKAQAQQTTTIMGKLQDSVEFKTTAYATVIIINPADSQIIAYTRTKDNGNFELKTPAGVKLRLLIVHPSFADYEDFFTAESNTVFNFGNINLLSKINLLKEAIVKDKLEAIRIKGDTTEFLVDSFLTNKQSNVEDLLKRLPGIQVDKDGKITAQGKEVKKVLVDGEEFFGDDPTVATKNLKAKQVESVQVYDKKSDQAAITGVDDGVKEKTINLKLKEDAKKGYFGKVSAGVGTENRYEHEAMFNRFNKKQKLSAYGALSNTNKTTLSWEDSRKYEGDNNMEMNEDGYMYTYNNERDDQFDGVGIPETWYVGVHFSDKYKNDKHQFGFNATHKEMTIEGFDSNYAKYILPDTLYFNNDIKRINSQRKGDNFSLKYQLNFDSLSTLKLNFSGAQSQSKLTNNFVSENRNELAQIINRNSRNTHTDADNITFKTSLSYSKKFAKKGRNFLAGFNYDYSDRNSHAQMVSTTDFYADLTLVKQDTIDQLRTDNNTKNKLSANASYTEPIGTKFFVVLDYSTNITQNQSALITTVASPSGGYLNRIDSLSNSFNYDIAVNTGGVALKYQYKKITTSAGIRASHTNLNQDNQIGVLTDTTQEFINIFPTARFAFKVGTSSNFDINYSGRTTQPTLQQIQPVLDNSNPLYINIGNKKLVQSFTNNIRMNYNFYKPISGSGVWSYLNFSQTNNDFSGNDFVDSLGRRVAQTINVNGNKNINGSFYYWFNIKKIKSHLSNHVSGGYSNYTNMVNGLSNVNKNNNYTYGANLSHSQKDDKYYLSIGGEATFRQTTTSLRPDVKTQFWTYEYTAEASFELPWNMEIESEAVYNVRQKTADFTNNLNTCIINIELIKTFGKNEQWETGVSCRDLLNQNIGFSRNAYSNFINENVHTVLRRYFMLRLTYNINSANKLQKEETK